MRYLVYLICIMMTGISASAVTFDVGAGYPNSSLTNTLSKASDGDTVRVHGGEFHEGNIIIDKRLVVIGENRPILDGDHQFEVVSIKHHDVVFEGFEIRNCGRSSMRDLAGIKIYDSNRVIIRDNVLKNTFFGIYTQYGKQCRIEGNTLIGPGGEEQQCGNGIHCWKCDSMVIIGNTASMHRDGVYFEFVTNSVIWRNVSTDNVRYGLHFMFSNHDLYASNQFYRNGAGVAVMFSNHVHMFNNYFSENWGDAAYGILFKEISDSHVEGNVFENNTSAIFIEGGSRINMLRNKFMNNGWGLKIQASCMEITLTLNEFLGNSFDVATNGTLVLNSFDGNYWDNYGGYDLDKDGRGDVVYRPVSMYGYVVERNPSAMLLFRSMITSVMDETEKLIPSLTPVDLVDHHPRMKLFLE